MDIEKNLATLADSVNPENLGESALLDLVLENMPASILITNIDGMILYANPFFCSITGFDKSELLGQNPKILKSGYHGPEYYEKMWETLLSGGKWEDEFYNRKKNGEYYWELAKISPIKDSKGKILFFVAIKEDVTEKKLYQTKLEQYSDIADRMRSSLFIYKINREESSLVLIDLNPSAEKLFSFKRAECIGKSMKEIFKGYEEDEMREKILAVITKNADYDNFDLEHVEPDGSIRWFTLNIFHLPDECVAIIVDEVTQQHNISHALISSEEKFRTLFEKAGAGIAISDQTGNIQSCNRAFCDMTGYNPVELLDMNFRVFTHPDDVEAQLANLEKLKANSKQSIRFEMRYIKKTGEMIWTDASFFSIQGPVTQGRYIISIVYDVSERKRTEESIRSMKTMMELGSRAANVALWEWNIATGELFWSDNIDEMLGFPPGSFGRGMKDWENLIHPEDRQYVIDMLQSHVLTKTLYDVEYRILTASGNYLWWRDTGSSFRDNLAGQQKMWGACVDITSLKTLERKLKEVNSTKDKFLSIIAHDLKNHFTQILGLSELLLMDTPATAKKDPKEYIRLINTSSRKTYNLLENLLTWARSQKGYINFTPEEVELKTFIEQEADKVADFARGKEISVNTNISNSENVILDKNMISTVIRNLLSNSVKFTPAGGVITIAAKCDADFITIAIIDSGKGMTQDVMDKLFRIDVNVTTLGTSKEKGTGLGLILCKEFIEKHDGNIWVESELDKGSTFSFTISRKIKPA